MRRNENVKSMQLILNNNSLNGEITTNKDSCFNDSEFF